MQCITATRLSFPVNRVLSESFRKERGILREIPSSQTFLLFVLNILVDIFILLKILRSAIMVEISKNGLIIPYLNVCR